MMAKEGRKMWFVAVLLILIGVVLLVLNKLTSKKEGVSKKQSYISIGVVYLIVGTFQLVGLIIKSLL